MSPGLAPDPPPVPPNGPSGGHLQAVAEPGTLAKAVRTDLDWVGRVLGESLGRLEGPGLWALVEEIKEASRTAWKPVRNGDGGAAQAPSADGDGDAGANRLPEVLAGVDLPTEILLVRAFSAYFHLANVVQQVHEARRLDTHAEHGDQLADLVDRIAAEQLPRPLLEGVIRRMEMRPIFTSHPTQAARRSVLTKMRQVRELLQAGPARPVRSGTDESVGSPRSWSCSGRPTSSVAAGRSRSRRRRRPCTCSRSCSTTSSPTCSTTSTSS